MNNQKKPELLSPAGSIESLYAAVNNGCDAIYLGGKMFSARQYAGNFDLEELEKACDYCHLRSVKLFVTVNTVYKEKEIKELMEFIDALYKMGVDALIVQDLGAASLIRSQYPDFELHASTQLTTNSLEDVNFLYENGMKKVVLSRELSLKEIAEIKQGTEAEIETFVHGALCVSYSGRCIMSSMLGGRSGNRGRCAQTCRLPYSLYSQMDKIKEGYLLCPKDIQTVTILPELIEAGIDSFKIEGRMKSPEYVAGVTGIYRKYIDKYFENPEQYEVEEKDIKILLQLFNRGGFTQGYYKTHSGSTMMSIERPKPWGLKVGFVDTYNSKIKRVTIRTREPMVPGDGIEIWTKEEPHTGSNISKHSKAGEIISLSIDGAIGKNDVVYKTHDKQLSDMLKKTWEKGTRKKEVFAELRVKIGEPMAYKLWDNEGNYSYITGEIVQEAMSQPISFEKLKLQASKTGNTPFLVKDISIIGDEKIYISVSSVNELRRRAVESLSDTIIKKTKRVANKKTAIVSEEPAEKIKNKKMYVLVNDRFQFDVACNSYYVNRIYFELCEDFEQNLESCITQCKENQIELFAALPSIDRSDSDRVYGALIKKLIESDIDGFLVRSPGQFRKMTEFSKKLVIDYSMNVFNNKAMMFWKKLGASGICTSLELNLQEINEFADQQCEMVVYGYLPLMTTQQCPAGAYDGGKEEGIYCSKKGNKELYYLKDRKGFKFPLMTNCKQCVCTILNCKPLFTLKFFDEILESTTGAIRLEFTKEVSRRVERVLNAYGEMMYNSKSCSIETKILMNEMAEKGSTKGHFFRGVE